VSALTFEALRRLADGRFHSGEDIARSLHRSRATLCEALKGAPGLGVELFSVPGKGYRLSAPIEFLDAPAISAKLAACDARLKLAAQGAPTGTCLAAEWQRTGRGRRGRSWISSLGGSLTFSLLWRFERGAGHLGGLSLAVGEAIARALAQCGAARAQVKWPNDVVCDFRKLAGILVETSGEMQGPSVAVVGVGVNYRLDERTLDRIDQAVTDVVKCASVPPTRSDLLAAMLASLAGALDAFDREGFAASREAWRALHAYQGRAVRVLPAREAAFEAQVVDVAPDGALVVATPDGRTVSLASAEITLRAR
jgi:BirA family biotin operon repressor/biotin-[acetyl-CoA-carboxylase] ligase